MFGGGGFGASKPAFGGGGFGQPAAGGAFGAAAGGGFGQPAAGGFGASKPTFGAPAGGGFGQPAAGGFGAAASTGGAFGAPAAGGFGAFGKPATSGAFGAPAAGGFGASTGGAFGAPAAGAFGAKPAFGASTGGAFGAPAAGAFGQPAAGAFGAASTGGAFGASTGGGFGAPGAFGAQAQCPGTQRGQFQPAPVQRAQQGSTPAGTDSYQTIATGNFSPEELRMADYQQGKHKGAGAPAAGAFGAAASTGGAFGAAATGVAFGSTGGAFGAASGGAFGAAAPATGGFGGFGAPASSAATGGFGGFGAAAGGFGASKPAFGGFGAAAAQATSGFGGFGAGASSGGAFGAPASSGGFGGFGASTGAATGFGGFGAKPATGAFGGFGSTAASSSGFGAASTGGFGGFGASSGAATGGFGGFGTSTGAATGGFGGFGAKPAAGGFGGFGASTGAATGGFGGFGAKPAAGGFGGFGASTGGFGGFGSSSTGGFGGFGAKPATSSFGSFGTPASGGAGFGAGFGMSQPMMAAANMGMVNPAAQMQMQAVLGGMPTETNPLGPSPFDKTAPPPIADSSKPSSKTSTAVVFPDTKRSTEFVNTHARSGTRRGTNGSVPMRPRTSRLASPAQEAISSPGRTPRRRAGLSDTRVPADESFGDGALSISASWAPDPRVLTMDVPPPIDIAASYGTSSNQSGKDLSDGEQEEEEEDDGFTLQKDIVSPPPVTQNNPEVPTPVRAPYEPSKLSDKWQTKSESLADDFPRLPSDCSCKPSLEDIRSMPEDSRKRVEDFTICREGFGAICFEGYTDTTSLDLTTSIPGEGLVMWEGQRNACSGVVLYPEELLERLGKNKPARGEELNKPAVITLNFQPNWKAERIREGIDNAAENDGDKMKFISYNEDSGELKFRVKHFTRWGLSAAVIDEATPRGKAAVDDSMDDSDAENVPTESFLKIGGHSSVRITPSSEQKRFAKPATAEAADSDSMEEDDVSNSYAGGADDTVRKALEALGSNRDDYRQDDFAVNTQRSFFKGTDNGTETNMVDGSAFGSGNFAAARATQGTSTGPLSGAVVVVPDRNDPESSINDVPTKRKHITMPTRDPREELGLPHESHEYSTNDGVALNREDFGAMMGRSFRVGWGPGGMMIYNFSAPEKSIGTLQLQTFTTSKLTGDSTSEEAMTRDLETRLAHYKRESSTAVDLLEQYVDTCDSEDEKHVWKLVRCLYLGDAEQEQDVRRAVSTWLQQVTMSSSTCPTIVELLSSHQIEKACETAVKQRDPRLAALIAQADGPSELRAEVLKQVRCWKQATHPSFWSQMKQPERHVYAILSGDFDTTQADLGVSPEHLGWRSCLGLHMWYKFGGGSQSQTSLEQLRIVIDSYDVAWQGRKAPRPRPSYALPSCPQDQAHDVCYSLLQCYAQSPISLDPRAHRPAVMDCSFVWHLQSLLAEIPTADGSGRAALPPQVLHADFIFQLETRGLLRWAIYVATQWQPNSGATPPSSLEQTPLALELLCRYTPRLSNDDLLWLRDEVGLPLGWLTCARAFAAASVGDAVEETIRLAETLGQMGGGSSAWPHRRTLLAFAKQIQSALAPEVLLLVDVDTDNAGVAASTPFSEPLCRWARQRLRVVALSRLAPCFAAAPRRRLGDEDDLGKKLASLLNLLGDVSAQAGVPVWMTAAVGASAHTACVLEGAYLASQMIREQDAKTEKAMALGDHGRRSPTRPRLSADTDSSMSTETAMDEDADQSDDPWCVQMLRALTVSSFAFVRGLSDHSCSMHTLLLRRIAKTGLQELIRSHSLPRHRPLPGASPIAAYQVRS